MTTFDRIVAKVKSHRVLGVLLMVALVGGWAIGVLADSSELIGQAEAPLEIPAARVFDGPNKIAEYRSEVLPADTLQVHPAFGPAAGNAAPSGLPDAAALQDGFEPAAPAQIQSPVIPPVLVPDLPVIGAKLYKTFDDIFAFKNTFLPRDTLTWRATLSTAGEWVPIAPKASKDNREDDGVFTLFATVGDFPILDIVIRNPNDAPAVLTVILITAQRLWADPLRTRCAASVPKVVTDVYHVAFNSDKNFQTVRFDLVHEVPARSVDRIAMIIGNYGRHDRVSYEIHADFIYNDGRTISLPRDTVSFERGCGHVGPELTAPYSIKIR